MWPGLAVASSGMRADLVGDVDELVRVLELRRVDQVHAHEVGHLARGDALGDLADHLGVRDVGQVDLAVGVRLVPRGDEGVDHAGVATGALPHLEVACLRRNPRLPRSLRARWRRARWQPAPTPRRSRAADGLAPPPLQAATSRIAIAPRATSLRRLLIPCSSHDLSRGIPPPRARVTVPLEIECVHTISQEISACLTSLPIRAHQPGRTTIW